MSREDSYEITWLVRRLFRAMANRSTASLTDLDISAADRAVLEFLFPGEPLAVPEIADRYDVSRQHVQVTVNRLLRKGLVVTQDNPRHKRSSLVEITQDGKMLLSKIMSRDRKLVEQLFTGVSDESLRTTKRTLRRLLDHVNEGKV